MQEVWDYIKERKSIVNSLLLIILVLALPIGINLAKTQQIFSSRAAVAMIQLIDGSCVVERNGKKVVICAQVPLQLTSPFIPPQPSPSPLASVSPSSSSDNNTSNNPSPTPAGNPQASPTQTGSDNSSSSRPPLFTISGPVIKVTGSTGDDIQNALDQVKTSGGAVYVPAGTYNVAKKIRLFSNVALFGDGIDRTILQLDSSLLTNPDGLMSNDSNYGHKNVMVKDLTLRGLNQESGVLQCCVGLKLRQLDGGYFDNIKVEGFSWHGIWAVYKKPVNGSVLDTVKNVRISNCQIINNKGDGIALDSPSSENVVDHCTFSGNNSGTGQDSYLKSGAALSLFMDEDGAVAKNRLMSNTISSNSYRGISIMARNNITAIKVTKISDNTACYNTVENNGDVGIGDANSDNSIYIGNKINNNNDSRSGRVETGSLRYYDQSITQWDTSPGGTSSKMIEDESPNATNPDCKISDKLQTIPTLPNKPTAFKLPTLTNLFLVHAQENPLGTISADPNPCLIQPGQDTCTATINWSTSNAGSVAVVVDNTSVFSTNASGSQSAPWIGNSGNTFDLYANFQSMDNKGTKLASVQVGGTFHPQSNPSSAPASGNGTLSADPNPCLIQPGQSTCTSNITWSANADNVTVVVDNTSIFASGPQGTQAASWIGNTGNTFDLYANFQSLDNKGTKLATLQVQGTFHPEPSPSAQPSAGTQCNPNHPDTCASSSSAPGKVQYRLAECEACLNDAAWQDYSDDPTVTNFTLSDVTPGRRKIWVEFKSPYGEPNQKDSLEIIISDSGPFISGVTCNIDKLSRQNLKVSVSGDQFGIQNGKLYANGNEIEVLDWKNDTVTGIYKSPNLDVNNTETFKVKLKRPDDLETQEVPCRIDTSLISLGAKVFCRDEGKFDVSNVDVTFVDENKAKTSEKVSIDKDGMVKDLKSKLQAGKVYTLSIKAPYSLRRNATFVASDGTTVVSEADGSPFILPIGDIAPLPNQDNIINSIDRALLTRQWIASKQSANTLSGDFNKDSRVNSFDWACMRYDFGKSSDNVPNDIGSR